MHSRREFIRYAGYAGAAILASTAFHSCYSKNENIPYWLSDREKEYLLEPHQTNLNWFNQARFGLFVHYGLYSLLGRQEWVQFQEKIPVKKYELLKTEFHAKDFDADRITDLALESGMKYLNFMAKHHDSFCLWDSHFSDFNSVRSAAKRDLVAELSDQCKKKNLPLFLSYSYGRDWRHPHAPNTDEYKSFSTRPAYESPEPGYCYGNQHKLEIYVEFAFNQIKELLQNYGDIAGIWLGGTSTILSGPAAPFQLPELYALIRKQQPHALIANGIGVNGNEDFISIQRSLRSGEILSKKGEICDTMQPIGWGYSSDDDGKHKTADQVIEMLRNAQILNSNLLLNIGPLPSGEIHHEDLRSLKETGRIIEQNGIPA